MDGDAGFEKWELKGIWKSRLCPRQLVTDESLRWIELYAHYQAGHLALSGGALDQPAIYMHAMRAIQSAMSTTDDG